MRLRYALATLVMLALTACSTTQVTLEHQPPELSLNIVALWWSEAQIEGLNPDRPPPKGTIVQLDRWEYSDPIAVPNPDNFDVIATLSGETNLAAVELHAEQRWSVGRIDDYESQEWTTWQPLAEPMAVTPDAQRPVQLTLASVQLGDKQQALFDAGRWPWAYEVRAELRAGGSVVATAERRLEIRPGD